MELVYHPVSTTNLPSCAAVGGANNRTIPGSTRCSVFVASATSRLVANAIEMNPRTIRHKEVDVWCGAKGKSVSANEHFVGMRRADAKGSFPAIVWTIRPC